MVRTQPRVKRERSAAGCCEKRAMISPSTGSAASVTISAASTLGQLNVDLSQAYEYIKLSATPAFVSGTSPTVPFSGQIVLMGAHKAPPASTTT